MQQRSIVWVDANGNTTQTLPRGSAVLTALQSALLAASNADVQQWFEGAVTVTVSPSPVVADYISVRDRAKLIFQTAGGTIVTLVLPSPQAGIFLADGQTVDPANPAVIAIVTAAMAVLVDTAGNPVTIFLGGTRQ